MPLLLRAENLHKSYTTATGAASTPVLRGVSLTIEQGEIIAIVGSSGAGKSTLLHLLGALDEADEGTIELHSTAEGITTPRVYAALNDTELSALRNALLGFIFQFHHLLPEFTALENVMMPLLIAGVPQNQAKARAQELLEQVGLSERVQHKPDALSGGEQQRVAFARAMVNNPILVLADEPTGNLDAANSALLLDLMKRFRTERSTTFILVTHSAELAAGADKCLRLQAGQFTESV
ncbi:MAG: ABC transporter ATP-binding protein [Candidatus Kapaibacterium sp.]|nr:MAG: ABC transporter ATP-binding protein [Candidatus Kapabacteria bacterium]